MGKIIGLDVSKQWLDICVYNTRDKPKYHRFANDAVGHEEMIKLAKEQEIKLIICEPTGDMRPKFVKSCIIISNKYIRSTHIVLILLVNR